MASMGILLLVAGTLYTLLAVIATLVFRSQRPPEGGASSPAISVLKPLCGAEPGLYEHLRSFCRQDYPDYQIVFGLRDPMDPARGVVERLRAEFSALPIDVVIDSRQHGSSGKISNLINMLPHARHDTLVMADSDAFVAPDYLRAVTAPLLDPAVGLVSCIYRGIPTESIWSRLGAMYINEWYAPSVLMAWLFGHEGYVSGQTLCMRRETLRRIGGLQAVANDLPDDYRLGELVRGLGLRIVLPSYEVMGEHHEPSAAALIRHELRWMRTIRAVRPMSFRFMFFTFSLPLGVLGVLLAGASEPLGRLAWLLFAVICLLRLTLHVVPRLRGGGFPLRELWLLPVRDLLLVGVWGCSFFASRFSWRGSEFDVDPNGTMRRVS